LYCAKGITKVKENLNFADNFTNGLNGEGWRRVLLEGIGFKLKTRAKKESRYKHGTSDETALGLTAGGGGPIVWRRDQQTASNLGQK